MIYLIKLATIKRSATSVQSEKAKKELEELEKLRESFVKEHIEEQKKLDEEIKKEIEDFAGGEEDSEMKGKADLPPNFVRYIFHVGFNDISISLAQGITFCRANKLIELSVQNVEVSQI